MNRLKAGRADARGAPIEDPQVLQDALQALFEAETEFFIKVEGTSTLPYASRVQQLHFPEGEFVLKLVRPLPHEMPPGALFRMTFAVDGLRFEASTHRLESAAHMGLLPALCDPGQRRATPALILADLALARSGDAQPLAAARILERQIAELGGPATAILCEEVDPTLLLAQETRTRFLPYPTGPGDRWVETLDAMLQP